MHFFSLDDAYRHCHCHYQCRVRFVLLFFEITFIGLQPQRTRFAHWFISAKAKCWLLWPTQCAFRLDDRMIYFWSIFVSLIHSFIYFIYFFCLRDCTLIFFEMRFWPLVIVVSVPSMHMHMHIYIACVYLTSEVPFRSFSASLPRSITAARLPTTLYAFDPIQHNTQHKACYSIINNLQLSLTWNLIIATENETNELIVDDFFLLVLFCFQICRYLYMKCDMYIFGCMKTVIVRQISELSNLGGRDNL